MLNVIGEETLNNYLNSYLYDNGFDAVCVMDTDFWVDLSCNIIHYSIFTDEEEITETYMEEISKDFPELACADDAMLAFFHEIGHIETEDEWTDEEWEACVKWKEQDCASHKEYFRYPTEWRATEWACNYILAHKNEVLNFWEGFIELLTEFYIINEEQLTCNISI